MIAGDNQLSIILAMKDWKEDIEGELERAEQARARGNEGQARVCARRAAGIAAREYFTRRGERVRTSSAYDLLNLLKDDPRLSRDLKLIAEHLTLRVNEEFKLPVNLDLIAEAKKFCEELLK
jgi:predicted phage-related endonuclease